MTNTISRDIIFLLTHITAVHGTGGILMKQPNDNNTIYTAALYLRLSKEDGYGDKDSVSIETQRDMLTRYCREHNIIMKEL